MAFILMKLMGMLLFDKYMVCRQFGNDCKKHNALIFGTIRVSISVRFPYAFYAV